MHIRLFLCGVLAVVLIGATLGMTAGPAAAKTSQARPAATQSVVIDITGMH